MGLEHCRAGIFRKRDELLERRQLFGAEEGCEFCLYGGLCVRPVRRCGGEQQKRRRFLEPTARAS